MSRNSSPIRPFLLAGVCAILASCSVADDDVVTSDAGSKKAATVNAVAASSFKTKSYAFSSVKPVAVAMKDETGDRGNLQGSTPYLGSAPYICTPSGFGRKAHCFLR